MLNAHQLKELATQKRKEKENTTVTKDTTNLLSPTLLEKMISEMEAFTTQFAEEGEFFFFYKLDQPEVTSQMILQLAEEFKRRHPHLFIVQNFGEKLICVDWSCKHEV